MLHSSDVPSKQLTLEMRIAIRELRVANDKARETIANLDNRSVYDLTRKQKQLWWQTWIAAVKPITINDEIRKGGKFANKGSVRSIWLLDINDRCAMDTYSVQVVDYDERRLAVLRHVKVFLRVSGHALEQVIRRKNEIGIGGIGGVLAPYVSKILMMLGSDTGAVYRRGDEFTIIDQNGYVGFMFDGFNMVVKTYIPSEQYHSKRIAHLAEISDSVGDGFVVTSRHMFDSSYQSGLPLVMPERIVNV